MQHRQQYAGTGGPGAMFFSAALFGFFGFYYLNISYYDPSGQFVFFAALIDLTLKISAVAFLLSGVITMFNRMMGNLIYSVIGLIGALAFALGGVLDLLDPNNTIQPILILLFAGWNGFSSYSSLRELLIMRAAQVDK